MVSIDRIKLAYLFSDLLTDAGETTNNQWKQTQTHSTEARNEDNERIIDQKESKNSSIPGGTGVVMRAGKRVRFRDEFQGT